MTSATILDPHELPADVESLKVLLLEREGVIAAQRERIAALEQRVHVLAKLVFGPSSEKRAPAPESRPPGQGWLFVRDLALEA